MKKYEHLHPPLIARITAEESKKRSEKAVEKATKTRLHQLYGAYQQPKSYKKAAALLTTTPDPTALLRLHTSTLERLPHYQTFYQFILSHIPAPQTILDLGCGFNPFSLPILQALMPTTPIRSYHAFDIDDLQAALINRFFALLHLPENASCADLATITPTAKADIAFLLKLLPVLEAQTPGRGYQLARALNAPFLVISYPLKSLGGKEKGMARFYRHTFEQAITTGLMSPFTLRAEKEIGTEWVCILKNPANGVID